MAALVDMGRAPRPTVRAVCGDEANQVGSGHLKGQSPCCHVDFPLAFIPYEFHTSYMTFIRT